MFKLFYFKNVAITVIEFFFASILNISLEICPNVLQIGPYGTQTQLAVVPPVAIATTSSGDDDDPPPPPSPPKPKVEKLPPNWKSAKDSEGKTYYYHTVTRFVCLMMTFSFSLFMQALNRFLLVLENT